MGAGASTEFNAEAVLSDEGDPTEPVADEGYDSDLAGDVRSLADHRPARDPAKPEVDNVRGRLSMYPEVGGKASKLPCAEHIKKPELYPHDAPHNALELPDDTLKLEFVHGYRAHDVRGNLAYDTRGHLVFPAAALCVVMDPTTRKQRFFDLHTDDVLCLAMHPSGDVCATAQVGDNSPIHVWRTSDCARVATIFPKHGKATLGLAFSQDGVFLASVGADELHTVMVYDWESGVQKKNTTQHAHLPDAPHYAGTLIASDSFGRNTPYVVKFNPVDGRLVVGGKVSLKFYVIDGDALRMTPASYAHGARKGYAQSSILSLTFLPDGSTFGGTQKGDVYKYEEGGARAVRKFANLHHGPIHDLMFTGKVLVSAGKDGKVKMWSVFMQGDFQIQISKVAETLLDPHWSPISYNSGKTPCVRAVASTPDAKTLAVGISTSEIYTFQLDVVGDHLQKERQATKTAKLALQAHCGAIDHKSGIDEGDVWDIAMHPKLGHFATVGEDKSVRVWSLKDRKMLRHARLPNKGRSVAWHPHASDGCDHVAVGTFCGKVIVTDVVTGTTVAVGQHAPEGSAVLSLKYSPCGKFLGVASGDGRFRTLDVYCGYKLVDQTDVVSDFAGETLLGQKGGSAKKADAGPDAMTHCDWSCDSRHVAINTAGGGLKFFTAPQCDAVSSNAPEILAQDWSTMTLPYSWGAQGVWAPTGEVGDINAVARSNKGDWVANERLLAVADDFGFVKLTRYPANLGVSNERSYRGHSARVTQCAFSCNDKYLVTTGGGDRCVFVWRRKDPAGPVDGPDGPKPPTKALDKLKLDAKTKPPASTAVINLDDRFPDDTDSDLEDETEYVTSGKASVGKVMVQSGVQDGVAVWTPINAENGIPNPYKNHSLAELGCLRGYKTPMTGNPVLAQTHVPSWWRKESTSYDLPKSRLKLNWAYGYRGHDTRQNCFYNSHGEVVYHTAALGVVYNPIYETQRHVTDDPESGLVAEGNTDDILCMARHVDKTTFATGETGRKPKIVVWSSDGCKALAVLQGFHRNAVVALCFSPCGRYLASVGQDANHSVAIYDWKQEELLVTFTNDKGSKVCGIHWNPECGTIVTTGVKHVSFVENAWSPGKEIKKGTVMKPRRGVFGGLGKWQNFYTAAFTKADETVVGTQHGQLYVFSGNNLTRVIPKAHEGKVSAVFCLKEHNVLLSGGDDGVVRFWRADDLSALHSIRIESVMSGAPAQISSITTDVKSKALVGTKCGEIWEISDEARLLVEAHGKGELWGLAIHPSDANKLATCSDDGTLRLWNITPGKGRDVFARAWPRKEDSQPIPNSSFNTGCARSVAWHPDGNSLAVGTVAGKVHVYELYSYKGQSRLTCIKELDTRNEWISDLKYSPCTPEDPTGGRYLAVGSHENAVDIYDTKKPNAEYELVGTCRGHSSFITHLGWSKDGTVLYTNSGDYELLFWYAPKGVQIVNGVDVKDVGWADTTGVLGFETTGVWYRGSDGTDVNSADIAVVHGEHGYQERVCVTGDDRGLVSLFRAPALGGKPRTYGGHSSHVATVRFSRDGGAVFTAGGGDGTVLQWEVIPEGRDVTPKGGAAATEVPKQTVEHDAEDIGGR